MAATALLLAAHGERRAGAANDGAMRLAAALSGLGIADEVGVGFIKGTPSIGKAIRTFAARRIIVYPLFLSEGYFSRVRLAQALDAAWREDRHRVFHVLPPLGLDPGFADVVAQRVVAAQPPGSVLSAVNLILIAHGSTTNPASRIATQRLATEIRSRSGFRSVRCAFLDEPPSLHEANSSLPPPLTVVGLFAGDGRHASLDVPRLIAKLARDDVVFAGTMASLNGVERLVAAAVARENISFESNRREMIDAMPRRLLHLSPPRGGVLL
jgi:sirohydrochlorin cobaltochelatase